MKRLAFAFMIIAFLTTIAAQKFTLGDLVFSDEEGTPSLAVSEPFPWGIEPIVPLAKTLRSSASSVKIDSQSYSYAYGKKIDGEVTTTVWVSGVSQLDWAKDGESVAWSEGAKRFF